jgi:hypothetical protein
MKVKNEVIVSVASRSEFFTRFRSNMWPCVSFRSTLGFEFHFFFCYFYRHYHSNSINQSVSTTKATRKERMTVLKVNLKQFIEIRLILYTCNIIKFGLTSESLFVYFFCVVYAQRSGHLKEEDSL